LDVDVVVDVDSGRPGTLAAARADGRGIFSRTKSDARPDVAVVVGHAREGAKGGGGEDAADGFGGHAGVAVVVVVRALAWEGALRDAGER